MRDTLIIGAGPAGLTAATYLGRFRRPSLVIDGGASRARWIPKSHNIPAFAHGIGGTALLSQLRTQALSYGTEIRAAEVMSIDRIESGFAVHTSVETVHSRYVLLGTGVVDHLPEVCGAAEAVLRSLLKICPICDAFEATGKNIAVIGSGEHGAREAEFLRTYSDRVTLLHIGPAFDPEHIERFAKFGVRLVQTNLADLQIEERELRVRSNDGIAQSFDVLYVALGCSPQNELAARLGAERDDSNALLVNSHQETSVPGLYAAGDIVRGLNQVVVAAAEAAIAATDIHNKLRQSA